jgi:hypothetical protein
MARGRKEARSPGLRRSKDPRVGRRGCIPPCILDIFVSISGWIGGKVGFSSSHTHTYIIHIGTRCSQHLEGHDLLASMCDFENTCPHMASMRCKEWV